MRIAIWAQLLFGSVLLCGWCGNQAALAQEFRIETDVFVGNQKEPVVETLTIFSDSVVYDFLRTGVEEITLFDRKRNRLVLMDTKRQVKTELTLDDIDRFMATARAELNDEQREALLGESAQVTTDDAGWVTLATERVVYRAECIKPKEPAMVQRYQEFANWYARLNTMRGNPPPYLRIRLNSEIAKRGAIPKTIERTISDKSILHSKKQVVRSRHLANWRLSNSDRKLIDRAGTYLTSFPTVTFLEYIQLPAVARGR